MVEIWLYIRIDWKRKVIMIQQNYYIRMCVVVGFLGTSLIESSYFYDLYVSNTSGATWTEVSLCTRLFLLYTNAYIHVWLYIRTYIGYTVHICIRMYICTVCECVYVCTYVCLLVLGDIDNFETISSMYKIPRYIVFKSIINQIRSSLFLSHQHQVQNVSILVK